MDATRRLDTLAPQRARLERANAIVVELLDLADDLRAAQLQLRCGDDPALLNEVQAQLAAVLALQQSDFLAATDPQQRELALLQAGLPAELRLLRPLGRGGMGVVYLAERARDGFRQQVAVKLLGAEAAAGHEAQARFVAERAILAGLEHPHIARFLDGGSSTDGRPYLVLEYVEGETLDHWCRQHAPELRERIELFLKVCTAVQYAHQQLVVHRDLKPGNVLVTAGAEPKLLDFGIARLLPPGAEATLTALGERAMTLRYASPEQVLGLPIGTPSDIYSLGVLLFQLLTGRLPYRDSATSEPELARAICEEPPRVPSTLAGTTLRRRLDADLDQIVLKALRKEPAQRYASVAELAADLRRYLAGEPVLARRGSRLYHFRKFVGRHRFGVAVALAALLLGSAFMLDRQRQLQATRAERDRAEQSLALLREVLTSADPSTSQGRELSAREILESGARKVLENPGLAPQVRFDLLLSVGEIEAVLGLAEQAELHFAAAAAAASAAGLGSAADERIALQRVQLLNGRGKWAEAEQLSKTVVANIDAGTSGLAPVDQARLLIARGNTLNVLGRGADAEPLVRRALALLPDEAQHARLRASSHSQLGQVLQNLGRLAEAETHLRQTLAIDQHHGFDPLRVSRDRNNLAGLLAMQGRFAEALELHRPAIAAFVEVLGREHPEYAVRMNNLGMTEYGAGEIPDAVQHLGEALQLMQRHHGADSPNARAVQANLAIAQGAAGEFEAAAGNAAEAHAGLLARFGRDNLQSIRAARSVAVIALERDDRELARSAFTACVDGALASRLERNPIVARCRLGLAELALASGDGIAARALLDQVRSQQASLDPRHFERGLAALVDAQAHLLEGQPELARSTLAAIPAAALNEPWQPHWHQVLEAAATGCKTLAASAARAALLRRYAPDHPRLRGSCPIATG